MKPAGENKIQIFHFLGQQAFWAQIPFNSLKAFCVLRRSVSSDAVRIKDF